jgi:glucose-1-phosphate adenylyltransferase
MAGGRGKRLMDLTDHYSKPGLDFGGKYRIIDFTLSNCVNSGFRRIMVLTQYNSHRLLQHLQLGWTFLAGNLNEYVHVLPAHQSMDKNAWYSGTADAVYQNMSSIQSANPKTVLILAGDHVYRMDYKAFLQDHLNYGADMTIACLEVPRLAARGFGIAQVDENDRIISFVEKPEDPPPIPGKPDRAFASMGIYLFNAEFLYKALMRDAVDPDSGHDFGKDIIPKLVHEAKIYAHRFETSCIPNEGHPEPYWRDVGGVDSYWEANMDLTTVLPALNLYDKSWPITTHQEQLPPAKFVHAGEMRNGVALSSLVSGGCIISGAHVHHSLLSSRVSIHSHARIDGTMVLPDCDIGRHARLRRCILARDCRIPNGLVVGEDPEEDARRFCRTEGGVTLISQPMLDRLDRLER